MKILRAEISGFGSFRERSFDFSPANQLFFGDNEAGKSTLYQFILAMLFGFPSKGSKKQDYTPQDGAAYGGRLFLQVEPFDEVIVERFRNVKRGKPTIYIDGKEKNEKILTNILAPLTKDNFCEIFTFQQEQLNQIDHLQEENLHASLISLGVSGSPQLFERILEYQKENQNLFKPRARKLKLNSQITQWQYLRKQIESQEEQESNVQQAYQEINKYEEQKEELKQEIRVLQNNLQTLTQQETHWALYEQWQELQSVKPMTINQNEQKKLQAFYHSYQNLTEDIQKKEDELSRLEQGQESDRYFFFLDHENEIQRLLKLEGTIQALEENEKQLLVQAQESEGKMEAFSKKWGPKKDQKFLQIFSVLDQLESIEQQLKQENVKKQWLNEHKQQVEKDIDHLEEKYPELLNTNQKLRSNKSLLSLVMAVVLFIVAFMTSSVMRFSVLTVAVVILLISFFVQQKKQKITTVKPLWQEKLVQLDSYLAELSTEEINLQELEQQESRLRQSVESCLGDYTSISAWRIKADNYRRSQQNYIHEQKSCQKIREKLQNIKSKQQEITRKFDVLSDWLPFGNKSLQEKYDLADQFNQQMQKIKLSRLQQPSTLLAQQLKQSKKNRDELFDQVASLLEKANISEAAEIPLWFKHWEKLQRQLQRKDELQQILTPIFQEKITKFELSEKIKENHQEQTDLQNKMRQLSERQQRLQLEVEYLQKNGKLDELYQVESRMKSEIQATALRWSRNQLLIRFFNDLATDLSEQQLPQLLEQTSYYFSLLTQQHYQKIELVNGILQLKKEENIFSVYDLSTGTKDQLIMAFRFSYLFMQRKRQIAPIIIDDGWLHYDSKRKATLAQLLAEFSQYYQIICLSSDQEMVSYYHSLNQLIKKFNEVGE